MTSPTTVVVNENGMIDIVNCETEGVVTLKTSQVSVVVPWRNLEEIDVPYFRALSNLRNQYQVTDIVLRNINVDHKFKNAWKCLLDTVRDCNNEDPLDYDLIPTNETFETYQLFLQTFPYNHFRFVEVRQGIANLCRAYLLWEFFTPHGLISLVRQRIEYYKSQQVSGADDDRKHGAVYYSLDADLAKIFDTHEMDKCKVTAEKVATLKSELMALKSTSDANAWFMTMSQFSAMCARSERPEVANLALNVAQRPLSYNRRLEDLSAGLVTRSMLSDKCVLAGGALVVCMFPDIDMSMLSPDSDVDLWVFDRETLSDLLTHFETTKKGSVRFLKNGPVTTVLENDAGVAIQIIARFGLDKSKTQALDVIRSFDVDYIQAFDNGKEVYLLPECMRAWEERRVVKSHLAVSKSRFDKAREKKFEVSSDLEKRVTILEEKKSRYDFFYPTSDMLRTMCGKRRRTDEHEDKYVAHLLSKVYPSSSIFNKAADVLAAYDVDASKKKEASEDTLESTYSGRAIDWALAWKNMNTVVLADRRSKNNVSFIPFQAPIVWKTNGAVIVRISTDYSDKAKFGTFPVTAEFVQFCDDVKTKVAQQLVIRQSMFSTRSIANLSNDIKIKLLPQPNNQYLMQSKIIDGFTEVFIGSRKVDVNELSKVCVHGTKASVEVVLNGVWTGTTGVRLNITSRIKTITLFNATTESVEPPPILRV